MCLMSKAFSKALRGACCQKIPMNCVALSNHNSSRVVKTVSYNFCKTSKEASCLRRGTTFEVHTEWYRGVVSLRHTRKRADTGKEAKVKLKISP